MGDLDRWAAELEWGVAAGVLPRPGAWWWELRLNPRLGTLEVRVPDAQRTVAEVAAVAAVVHALVAHLAARHDAGDLPPVPPDWRIDELRWAACRWGVAAPVPDPDTGASRRAADVLDRLLDALAPAARELGCAAQLEAARGMLDPGTAALHRRVAADGGPHAVARWLADGFLEGVEADDSPAVPAGTRGV
jgi:carboxylate-amine ligase